MAAIAPVMPQAAYAYRHNANEETMCLMERMPGGGGGADGAGGGGGGYRDKALVFQG